MFFAVSSFAAEREVRRVVSEAPAYVPRNRVLKNHRFLVERQIYLPSWNFLGRYTDRPLFTDVTL